MPDSENRASVALETSVLAQGLPFPANRDLARRLHDIVTAGGHTRVRRVVWTESCVPI